jgi:hypothetical protein
MFSGNYYFSVRSPIDAKAAAVVAAFAPRLRRDVQR